MKQQELENMENKDDHELLDYVTEKDTSQRKYAALHILERRRNKVLQNATIWACVAAWGSAIAACITAYAALIRH